MGTNNGSTVSKDGPRQVYKIFQLPIQMKEKQTLEWIYILITSALSINESKYMPHFVLSLNLLNLDSTTQFDKTQQNIIDKLIRSLLVPTCKSRIF